MGMVDNNLTLELNPNHELIVKINEIRKSDTNLANLLVR